MRLVACNSRAGRQERGLVEVMPSRLTHRRREERVCERNVSGTVLSVVEENLCHGCGTCAAACPRGAIQMAETPAGFLVPRIDSDCTSCGLCLTTCPGAQFAERLLDGDADPFRGNVLGAWIARAVDERQFHDGQSAGVVTALLAHMMQSRACDGTLVVGPVDQSKRPRPFVARSPEELGFAQGSKYCPCAVNAEVREPAFTKLARPAVVGLSCHAHGLRLLSSSPLCPFASKPIVLGLICTGIYSFHMIDHLQRLARPECLDDDFKGLRFKDKAAYGWPGDVSVYSDRHVRIRVPARERTRARSAFLLPRCHLCFDRMNVLSDLAFGDPWGLRSDPEGWTVVLTRTKAGHEIMTDALAAGAVVGEPVDPESVVAGQKIDSYHRPNWALSRRVWGQMGGVVPDFGFDEAAGGRVDLRQVRAHRRLLEYGVRFCCAENPEEAVRLAQSRMRRTAVLRTISRPWRSMRAFLEKVKTGIGASLRAMGLRKVQG